MARGPAYNSRVERERRAQQREKLLSEVAGTGEAGDELIPLLSAWMQVRHRLHEYEVLTGRPYDRHAQSADTAEERLRLVRDHLEIALGASHSAEEVERVAGSLRGLAADSSFSAYINARVAVPYTEDETAVLTALHSD